MINSGLGGRPSVLVLPDSLGDWSELSLVKNVGIELDGLKSPSSSFAMTLQISYPGIEQMKLRYRNDSVRSMCSNWYVSLVFSGL